MQCGSYIFMGADYQRVRDREGAFIHEFENSLFIYSSIMSKTKHDNAICDAGLKAQSVDSGLPVVFGRDDVEYIKCSDEHGVIADPGNVLKLNDKLWLVPGHCDPTCNVHDWYVGVRNGKVETLWPVTNPISSFAPPPVWAGSKGFLPGTGTPKCSKLWNGRPQISVWRSERSSVRNYAPPRM